MEEETWAAIAEWTGYSVSTCGNVRHDDTGRLLKGKLSRPNGYRLVRVHGVDRRVHRLVAIAFIANPDGLKEVDHINHVRTDNRVCNLRWASTSQNQMNRKKSWGSSKFKGVSFDRRKRKWGADLKKDGKKRRMGYFESEEEAAKAYDEKARELFGDFAWLNFGHNDGEVQVEYLGQKLRQLRRKVCKKHAKKSAFVRNVDLDAIEGGGKASEATCNPWKKRALDAEQALEESYKTRLENMRAVFVAFAERKCDDNELGYIRKFIELL